MKLTIAAIAAFATSAFAALSINSPVAGTKWANGAAETITWISDDSTALTGTVTVQLMSGSDPNNLSLVDTIATGLAASAGKVSYTPATTLPFGTYYAIRITSSVDGPHYSHFFAAGNPAVTEAPSSSAASTTASAPATASASASASVSASASHKTSELGSLSEDSDATEASSAKPKSTSGKASATKSKATSSAKPTSSEEEEEESSSAKPSKAESSSHSNGASRPALAAGLLGVAVFAAMF
ncbi:hypothetical protein EC988_000054 [Linderina pennispora]|nr:hypothetical protein EC988_000054 [Linderina pennispora]